MTKTAARSKLGSVLLVSTRRHPRPPLLKPVVLFATLSVIISVVAVVYQPWVNTPFDILDFSDFLATLRQNDSFWQRVAELTRQYAAQGRFNLLNYTFLAWKWSLFGWNEAAWQIARSVQMLCIVFAVYMLLRRLGAGRCGSLVGAALFIVAQTASPAWIRLPMGEPLGLMTALGAGLLAASYQKAARWRAAGATIAVLLTATVLTKELLVVLVPFALLLACARYSWAEAERPHLTRRNMWVVSLTAGGVMAVGIPVMIIARKAATTAYSSDYGKVAPTLGHFLYSFLSIMLPVRGLFDGEISLIWQLGNLLFLSVALAGWSLVREDAAVRRQWMPAGIAAVSLAVTAVLIYMPLPYFQDYYGLPFVLSPAILIAIAVTVIERRRPAWRWVAYAGCAVTLTQGALDAGHDSRAAMAARKIHRALVDDFAAHAAIDSIVVLVRNVQAEPWKRRGPTLGRYANAVLPDHHFPTLVDEPCSAMPAENRTGAGRVMVVSYSSQCGSIPGDTRDLRVDYSYIEWPTLRAAQDSMVISILGPSARTR